MNTPTAIKTVAMLQATWVNHPFAAQSPKAYQIGLEGIPVRIIGLAVEEAIRTCKFCPYPAELRAIAERIEQEEARTEQAAIEAARPWPPPGLRSPTWEEHQQRLADRRAAEEADRLRVRE